MKHTSIRKPLSVLLSILMVLSVFGGMAFTAAAAETPNASGNDPIELNCNVFNAEVIWDDQCSIYHYWHIEAFGADYEVVLSNEYSEQAAGTYAWADMDPDDCWMMHIRSRLQEKRMNPTCLMDTALSPWNSKSTC